jgi:CCR4-NOT transcription complex subunit 4
MYTWDVQEDAECPLCLEEMDISDLNFKPCVCGYQVRIHLCSQHFVHRLSESYLVSDLPILLASYQGEPQWSLPRLPARVHRGRRAVQGRQPRGVGSPSRPRYDTSANGSGLSHKRLMQAKKQRERERKELETLGRKHLANVRVVQRNVAYVTGLGSRFAKEEVRHPISGRLRSLLRCLYCSLSAHPDAPLE